MKENPLAFQTLDSYLAAKELARRVHTAKITDPELRDQATRASKSTFLCLCEGLQNTSVPMKNKHYQESLNSLFETLGAMDLAGVIGAAQPDDAAAVQELGVRLVQMIRGLLH